MTNMAHSMLSNPRFLAEHIISGQKDAEDMAEILEEGMADGSIKQGNAKLLAELFMLLSNVWMMPAIFPASEEETAVKLTMLEQIFTELGFNFLDEEMGKTFYDILEKIDK
jgi:hypothetical protein